MSNRKTPNSDMKRRHYKGTSSRPVSMSDEKTNIIDKLKKIISKDNKEKETDIKAKRRNYDSSNKSRGIKTVYKESKELSKSRKKLLIKKYVIIGSVFTLVLATVLVIAFSNREKSEETVIVDENQTTVKIFIDNQEKLIIDTSAETVADVLNENGITIREDQKISCDLGDEITENMKIYISMPLNVTIIQNGIKYSVTLYGGQVQDALKMLEIEIDENDIIEPNKYQLVTDEMTINFTDVEVKQVVVIEEIPFEVEEGETSTVESGFFAITNDGKEGSAEITYEVKYINNEEVSRQEISRNIIEEPISKVVLWGTAPRSSVFDDDDDSDSGNGDDNDDNDDDTGYTPPNPNEQATNPSVPSFSSSYVSTLSAHVTAYTHTGGHTATGTWPRSTRTLANPGTCAVVPSTIPYGSLLYVTGYGYCIAEDTGGFRNDPDRWNQIDLFMNTRDECITWGRRYNVTVYIIREGY